MQIDIFRICTLHCQHILNNINIMMDPVLHVEDPVHGVYSHVQQGLHNGTILQLTEIVDY